MSHEPSTATRALRAVSLAIALVSVVTFSTMGYSAYADVSGVLSAMSPSGASATGARLVISGNEATLNLSVTVRNSGLYLLSISFGCRPDPSTPATCGTESLSIPPGATKLFPIVLTISDLSRLRSAVAGGSKPHLNATAQVSLAPFATLTTTFDLGSELSGAVS